ncbi:MAG: hypothetical protein ACJAS0_002357 [Alcanivorax borkumensis]|jgi:hypothetical protein
MAPFRLAGPDSEKPDYQNNCNTAVVHPLNSSKDTKLDANESF